ncbi:hypothetical protein [Flavobacterium sp. AED]|uniref:hypothetical protein n=1 Tax=Flavobacterium sp. AED TaxID=1423323 RepID=UPI00057E18B8|nr:hypothetical protein [Flavobacterium sp. AED]KIA86574.1 hypothetical protein OA85_02665 [Flavobacterium sp. AED]
MAKIKSNIELLYDSRDGKKGFLQVEITEWKFELANNRYSAIVNDYLVTIEDVQGVQTEKFKNINTKTNYYPILEIDTLFHYLNNSIDITEDFSGELDNLISEALLFETQARPIYESIDINWELC